MSSHANPNCLTFKAAGAIAKGSAVKAGADKAHVAVAAAATDKIIGIALNATTTAEDKVEVALSGGGAKGLVGSSTPAFGDHLTSDGAGALVVTTTDHDRVCAIAMDAGVVGDLISVHVVSFIY